MSYDEHTFLSEPLALAILFVCEDAQDAVVIWPVARFPAIALFEGSV